MDKEKLWQTVLAQLQLEISKSHFSLWFGKTFIKNQTQKDQALEIEIACPSAFVSEKLAKTYCPQIQEALKNITKKDSRLSFVVSSPVGKKTPQSPPGPLFSYNPEEEKKSLISGALSRSRINPDLTFTNFAVASTNEMAYAAATAVANRPGRAYNPLFLYGGVGVGKTHLMQAIGINMLNNDPQASILYCTGEEFTNEIIEAIRNKNTSFFKKKFRNVKLLLIDDIQFIAGRNTVQEEFFHTFNAIKQMGGQIAMTSDKPPEQIDSLENRLRSRFEGGLTIDIQEPNFELRTAILLIKAKQLKEELPIEAAKLIAQNITSTRKLEGILTRVISEKGLTKTELGVELVKKVLDKISSLEVKIKVKNSPDKIIKTVAEFYQLKTTELKGVRRLKHIVFPRQLTMYILRTELNLPYQEIGRLFGGKDHTTIMHSEGKIRKILASSEEMQKTLQMIKQKLL